MGIPIGICPYVELQPTYSWVLVKYIFGKSLSSNAREIRVFYWLQPAVTLVQLSSKGPRVRHEWSTTNRQLRLSWTDPAPPARIVATMLASPCRAVTHLGCP